MIMTLYQQLVMKVIEEDPQFDRWSPDPRTMKGMADHADVPGARLFSYYTKDGRLHVDRVGKTEIMFQITFQSGEARE